MVSIIVNFDPMNMLQPLNLPPYPFRITEQGAHLFIFDEIRKKDLVLTPEEWVRQHYIQYLIGFKNYPKGLIKLEGGLTLNGLTKRSDIVVFDRDGRKILLIECKAPGIKITQKVFEQVARYNMVHKVPFIGVTNGLSHYQCHIDFTTQNYRFIEEIPDYQLLQNLDS